MHVEVPGAPGARVGIPCTHGVERHLVMTVNHNVEAAEPAVPYNTQCDVLRELLQHLPQRERVALRSKVSVEVNPTIGTSR